MIDPNFQHVGPGKRHANAYRCSACGREIESDLPPAASNQPPGHPATVRARVLRQIGTWIQSGSIDRLPDEIEQQLDRCLTECRHFDGHVCTRLADDCDCWRRWIERLAVAACRHYRPPIDATEHRYPEGRLP